MAPSQKHSSKVHSRSEQQQRISSRRHAYGSRGAKGAAASSGKLEILRVPDPLGFRFGLDWLVHGFSTRPGGRTWVYRPDADPSVDIGMEPDMDLGMDLNLGFTVHDSPETVVANRKAFLEAAWGRKGRVSLATLQQTHSTLIRRMRTGNDSNAPATLKGDGLMTGTPELLLGIQTADCLPVLLADTRNRAVAAFHAGWRGTLARIVESGVGRMRLEFGSQPEDLIAAIGPGIGLCCYSVGEEVQQEFESQFSYAPQLFREFSDSDSIKEKYPLLFMTARAPGHSNLGPSVHLDLAEANRRQLLDAGLRPSAIYLTGECTSCRPDRFFSHRGEHGFTGRMMSVVGIRPV